MEIWYGLLWFVGIVWGGQMTTEFIHEEISIMAGMDDWHGCLAWMNSMDDWHG